MKNVFLKNKIIFIFILCSFFTCNPNPHRGISFDCPTNIDPKRELQNIIIGSSPICDSVLLYRNSLLDTISYLRIGKSCVQLKAPKIGMCGNFDLKNINRNLFNNKSPNSFALEFLCKDYFIYYVLENKNHQIILTDIYHNINKDDVMLKIARTPYDTVAKITKTHINLPLKEVSCNLEIYDEYPADTVLYYLRKDSLTLQKWFKITVD